MRKIILLLFLTGCAHVSLPSSVGSCPPDRPVKGNADSLIYHTESSPHYHHTKAEVCFDTKETARRHGYRASKKY
jgi:hypothetical protein